jgi:lipopolysaccharide transport system permease protein
MLAAIWQNRRLTLRLVRREVEARYRGSLLAALWWLVTPLVTLATYTFVFSVVFRARWDVAQQSTGEFALLLLCGLILFNVFSEAALRAPSLLLENAQYVKKLVFPVEILPCVSVGSALFNAAVGFGVLLAAHVVLRGMPGPTALLLPALLLPLVLVTLGASWVLASLGVFVRDLRQVVAVATPLLMFLCPIFYPLSAIPEPMRTVIALNPLTVVIEQARGALFWSVVPDWRTWALHFALAWAVCWAGFVWFGRTQRGFADVL